MSILNTLSLKNNRQTNFNGSDLFSDAGLLLVKEFVYKLGFVTLLKSLFKTNDTAVRHNKDDKNLWQVIYQFLGAYFKMTALTSLFITLCSQPPLIKRHLLYSQHCPGFSIGCTKLPSASFMF